MVCPSRASTYSPSIRMEIFCGKRWLLSLPVLGADVAAQAPAGLFERLGGRKSEAHFVEFLYALRGRHVIRNLAPASLGCAGGV